MKDGMISAEFLKEFMRPAKALPFYSVTLGEDGSIKWELQSYDYIPPSKLELAKAYAKAVRERRGMVIKRLQG